MTEESFNVFVAVSCWRLGSGLSIRSARVLEFVVAVVLHDLKLGLVVTRGFSSLDLSNNGSKRWFFLLSTEPRTRLRLTIR